MNKVFLIGKIITEIEFKFIINSKNISIAKFRIETLDKQIITIKAYNEIADYIYSKFNKNEYAEIYGSLETAGAVIANNINLILQEY